MQYLCLYLSHSRIAPCFLSAKSSIGLNHTVVLHPSFDRHLGLLTSSCCSVIGTLVCDYVSEPPIISALKSLLCVVIFRENVQGHIGGWQNGHVALCCAFPIGNTPVYLSARPAQHGMCTSKQRGCRIAGAKVTLKADAEQKTHGC